MSPEVFKGIREICPFDIPRYDEKSGGMAKCTMCFDRISEGLLPACVKSCPTGTMNFGDRDAILKMAGKRLDEVKRTHRRASLIIPESVRVIFLVKDDPEKYHKFASREGEVGVTRRMALAAVPGSCRPRREVVTLKQAMRTLRERALQLKAKRPGYGALLDFYVEVREAQAVARAACGWAR